jgi:D-lactate dehydrogenase (cytochrome)
MNIKRDSETINNYLSDESNIFFAQEETINGIYNPETEKEVVAILKQANETKTPVTISGGGTGITGSRVPVHGGLIISMDLFNSPLSIRAEEKKASLPPGISLTELDGALPTSLIYPPDPTEMGAFLGGTVATNASGARCFHYGPTREWITGARVVLANGDLLGVNRGECLAEDGVLNFVSESGQKYSFLIPNYKMPDVKNAAGIYTKNDMDLLDLFIGSEGIFGVFTEVTVRLENRIDLVSDIAFFRNTDDSLAYVNEAQNLTGQGLLSLEFFDENSLRFMRTERPEIKEDVNAAVFVEFVRDDKILASMSESQAKHNACEDWCAMTSVDARDLKELRHTLPDSINTYLKQHHSYKLGTDFVVPQDKFPEMLAAYKRVGESYKRKFRREGAHYVLFGHIGDCHLHFNFITHTEEEQKAAKKLYLELAQTAIKLGGTISGEHGVGKKTIIKDGKEIPYLELMYGQKGLKEIARVKKVFDPNGILNIGNMIPREYLL